MNFSSIKLYILGIHLSCLLTISQFLICGQLEGPWFDNRLAYGINIIGVKICTFYRV